MGKNIIIQIKMKLFSILAIYGASASACEDGIHANDEDCSMFYQCANGHRYEDQSCPEGLLYNAATERCDWPDNVECVENVDQTKWQCYKDCVGDKWWNMVQASKCSYKCSDWSKKVKKEKPSKECEDGIHAHEKYCNKFYQCANGHRYEDQECPEGLVFNAEQEYCDYPENVQCKEPAKKCERGDVYPHDSDCKKYYQCIGFGIKISRSCTKGQIFNKKTGECDWMWKPWVRC